MRIPPRESPRMSLPQKLRAATVGLLAIALLAGCSAKVDTPRSGTPEPSEPAVTSFTPDPDAYEEVRGVKLIDPLNVVVTPIDEDHEAFGEEILVRSKRIVVPAEGECGYEQTLASARELIEGETWVIDYTTVKDGVYFDTDGALLASLAFGATGYEHALVRDGMAAVTDEAQSGRLGSVMETAKGSGVGLWATCPDFGS